MPHRPITTASLDVFAARQTQTRRLPEITGYDLGPCLGRGGQGEVYAATQRSTGHQVAIKVLVRALAGGPDSPSRMDREAKILAALSHPGIVPVIDRGRTRGGTDYLVMRRVSGRSLEACLTELSGLDTMDQAREVFLGVCDAVAAAHRVGVLHRDLKPSNIMVTPEGNPCLLDFGIATASKGMQTHADNAGEVFCSPGYAAPEQLAGGAVDERVDVYALGVVLFRVLTGGHFPGPEAPEGSGLSPAAHRPGIRPGVDRLVRAALAPDPAGRPADADAFGTALAGCGRWVAHDRGFLPPGAVRPVRRRRRTLLAGLAGALVWATLIGVVSGYVFNRAVPQGPVSSLPDGPLRFGESAYEQPPAGDQATFGVKPLQTWAVPDSILKLAWLNGGVGFVTCGWTDPPTARRFDRPERWTPPALAGLGRQGRHVTVLPDDRWLISTNYYTSHAMEVLDPAAGTPPAVFLPAVGYGSSVVPGRSDRVVVSLTGDGRESHENQTRSLPDGGLVAELPSGRLLAVGPGGRALISGTGRELREVDTETGSVLRLLHDHQIPPELKLNVPAAAYRSDGRLIAASTGHEDERYANSQTPDGPREDDRRIRVFDAKTGAVLSRLTGHTRNVTSLQFSGDGRWLLSQGQDRTVRLWSLAERREVMRFGRRGGSIARAWFHPERRLLLLSGSRGGLLEAWDFDAVLSAAGLDPSGPVLPVSVPRTFDELPAWDLPVPPSDLPG